jgi:hypothetical protein
MLHPQPVTGQGFRDILAALHRAGSDLKMHPDFDSIRRRVSELKIEHRDLNDIVDRLSLSPGQDQLQLQRLKKRRLLLKDQIRHLERQLTPDIPA